MSQYLNILLKAPDGHYLTIADYSQSTAMYQALRDAGARYEEIQPFGLADIEDARSFLRRHLDGAQEQLEDLDIERNEILRMSGDIANRMEELRDLRQSRAAIKEEVKEFEAALAILNAYEEMVQNSVRSRGRFEYFFGIEVPERMDCLDETGGEDPKDVYFDPNATDESNPELTTVTNNLKTGLGRYADYLKSLNLDNETQKVNLKEYADLMHKLFDGVPEEEMGDPMICGGRADIDLKSTVDATNNSKLNSDDDDYAEYAEYLKLYHPQAWKILNTYKSE